MYEWVRVRVQGHVRWCACLVLPYNSQRVSRPGFDRDPDGGVYSTLEACSFSLVLWP